MKKFKLPLLALLVGVLMFSGVQGTKAYKVYKTTDTADTAFTLEANTEIYEISVGDLNIQEAVKQIGKAVEVESPILTNGPSEQYVRMVVTKHIDTTTENKSVDNINEIIEIGVDDAWFKGESSKSGEREVYYYGSNGMLEILAADETVETIKTIRIDGKVYEYTKENSVNGGLQYTTDFLLDGALVTVQIEVQGIQTHNANDAALDAWGVSIKTAPITEEGVN